MQSTGWAKKASVLIFAISLSTASHFSYFFAHMHYRKFVTSGCIVSPPNLVCVTTLPCKILTTTFFTLNFINCCKSLKKSSFYLGSNNCHFLLNDLWKNRTCWILLIFKWRVRPCGQVIIAMTADDVTNVSFGFKQFVTAVIIYAAANPLRPWTTYQWCAVICVISLLNMNHI